jgi:lipocalin
MFSACAVSTPTIDEPQFSVSSRFTVETFSGQWYVIEALQEPASSEMRYERRENSDLAWFVGAGLIYDPHGNGWVANQVFRQEAIGVLKPVHTSLRGAEDHLVHWIDEDSQTAVVGTPSRTDAWILNRTPTLRADRLQAAKDILKFNGYDLSQLKTVPQ